MLIRLRAKSWGYSESDLLKLRVADIDTAHDSEKFSSIFETTQHRIIPPFEINCKR